MISHDYRCIFIHIPKCAGTSIESALGHFDGQAAKDVQDHRSLRMIESPYPLHRAVSSPDNLRECLRRIRYRYLRQSDNAKNKLTVTADQYQQYFKFTFVRNPWARAFSWYQNVLRDQVHRQYHGITDDTTFKDFLQETIGTGMLRSQTYWLKNYAGQVDLDFVGRFETLHEDFTRAMGLIGAGHIQLPHKLKGCRQDYRLAYDQDLRDLVQDYYAEEIALFGYTFEGTVKAFDQDRVLCRV